jgi:L-cysteine desulfidase
MSWDLERLATERPDDFGFESVVEAQEAIKAFHSDEDRRERVVSLVDELVTIHLDTFLAQCAPNCTSEEKSTVVGLVFVYMEVGRFDRVSSLISDIAQHGLAKAIKKSAKVDSGSILGLIFAGVWATVEVIVVMLVIGAVDSGFQTLAISCLILIYAQLSFTITSGNMSNIMSGFGQTAEIRRIRNLLKDRLTDTDQMHTDEDNLDMEIKKLKVQRRIYVTKLAVLMLIGIVEILRTVFGG